jgi:hypothetical protein
VALQAGEKLVYACLSASPSPCPGSGAPEVLMELAALIEKTSSFCVMNPVKSVPCGPDPQAPGCCYEAVVGPSLCEGRPFTIAGSTRSAPGVLRAGFAAPMMPDVSRLDAATRSALARAWEREALYEHASIASFARFTLELLSAGVPAALVAEAHRAMGDEIHHAELCFGLAGAYGDAPRGPGRLPIAGALEGRDDLATIVAAAVTEGCIGETIAALVAEAQRDAAEDPAVHSALERIAADETRHATLAWRFVAWAVSEGPSEVQSAAAAAFSVAVPAWGPTEVEHEADTGAMRAHGRLPDDEVRAIATHALAEVILPCARAMLGGIGSPASTRLRDE